MEFGKTYANIQVKDAKRAPVNKLDNSIGLAFYISVNETEIMLICISWEWKVCWK